MLLTAIILFAFSDTLYFRNPKVILEGDSSNLVDSVSTKGSEYTLNFTGSKGFFVSFDGVSLSLSQSLDITLSGSFSKRYSVSAILRDHGASYGSDYYTASLTDVDEVFFELKDTSSNFFRLGKIYFRSHKILGFWVNFNPLQLVYGSMGSITTRKELFLKYPYKGPYFIDYGYLIVPGSFRLLAGEEELDRSKYSFDYTTGSLWINDLDILREMGRVCAEYQTFAVTSRSFLSLSYSKRAFRMEFEHFEDSRRFYEGLPQSLRDSLSQGGDLVDQKSFQAGIKIDGGDYILVDSIYVFVGRGNGDYSVYFDFAGIGKGSYIFDSFLGGYRYVGENKGNYEPSVKITTPKRFDVFSLSYYGSIFTDLKLSYSDLNTLSGLQDDDNLGVSFNSYKEVRAGKVSGLLGLKGKSKNFMLESPEFSGFWGLEGRSAVIEQFGSLDFLLSKYHLNYSIRYESRKLKGGIRFFTTGGPVDFSGDFRKEDSTAYRFSIHHDIRKAPDPRLILEKSSWPLVLQMEERGKNFDGIAGIMWHKDSHKILPFFLLNMFETGDLVEYKTELSYLPTFWKELIYRVNFSLKALSGFQIGAGISKTPDVEYVKEERFYRSPHGGYEPDTFSGLFVPASSGGYERQVLALGISDTALKTIFTTKVEYNSSPIFLQASFERWLKQKESGYSLEGSINFRGAYGTFTSRREVDSTFTQPCERAFRRYELTLPIFSNLFLAPAYEYFLRDNLYYSVLNSGFEVRSGLFSVRSGFAFTNFQGEELQSFLFQSIFTVNRGRIKGFASLILNVPLRDYRGVIPLVVPTSRRLEVNASFKYVVRQGEFFFEGTYLKKPIDLKRLRMGYSFLF
ncbi:MAG: hypothetical protein ACPLN0_02915 [Candidatus Hydrothermia bacterium]